MKNKLREALKVLTLANSDTRDATIESLIVGVLFSNGQVITKLNLSDKIFEKYSVRLNQFELDNSLEHLLQKYYLNLNGADIELSEEFRENIGLRELRIKSIIDRRKASFERNIRRLASFNLEDGEIDELFDGYEKYILEMFYLYGHSAYLYFHPYEKTEENEDAIEQASKDFLIMLFDEIEYTKLLEKYLSNHHEYLSEDDVDYLFDLSQKANCFLSLGLPPKLHNEIFYDKIIDWVLFLDTNFIYSILQLHDHPENNACKELVKIIRDNDLPIRLTYLDITYKELLFKKREWESAIPRTEFSHSHVKAALKSGRLDGITYKYFDSILKNNKAALHPSDVVDQAKRILVRNAIEPFNYNLEILNEEFIAKKLEDYNTYLYKKNIAREEFGLGAKYRNTKQMEHDIFLREAMLFLRFKKDRKVDSMNDAKYFGITLDNLLLDFDGYEFSRKSSSLKYITFFKPSFLLAKIIRLLPVNTSDYKKSFIAALTSKSFHASSFESEKLMRVLNYLCLQGFKEEEIIYELITDDLFTGKLYDAPEEDKAQIIETELSKKFEETKATIVNLQSQLSEHQQANSTILTDKNSITNEYEKAKRELSQYENALISRGNLEKAYEKEIYKLRRKVESLEETSDNKTHTDHYQQQELNVSVNIHTPTTEASDPVIIKKRTPFFKRVWVWITGSVLFLGALAEFSGVNVSQLWENYKIKEPYQQTKDSVNPNKQLENDSINNE